MDEKTGTAVERRPETEEPAEAGTSLPALPRDLRRTILAGILELLVFYTLYFRRRGHRFGTRCCRPWAISPFTSSRARR